MYFVMRIFVCLLCTTLCIGKKSVTIVVDTTLSMQDEIDVIKTNLRAVLNSVDLSEIDNYILVIFKDPDVEPPRISASPSALMSHVNNLTVSGGQDCPENALAAIQKALEVSNPGSYIFIFTDAYAKDNSKLSAVQDLCLNTRSQVITILSGTCVPSTRTRQEGSIDVYFDVAKSCHGGIFQFEPINLGKGFDLMKEIVKTEWNYIETYDARYRDVAFSVDYSTKDLMMTVYGNDSYISLTSTDTNGRRQIIPHNTIIQTDTVLVIRLARLVPGNYKAAIRCQGRTSTTVYKRNDLPLQIGFSTRRTNILMLTSSSPMPGWMNYILVIVTPGANIKLKSLKIHNFKTNETSVHSLDEDNEFQGHYITSEQFDHDTSFQITISGQELVNYQEVTKTTKIMETQKTLWGQVNEVPETKPQVDIMAIEPRDQLVDYGSNVTLACRATGFPKPDISWHGVKDDNLHVEDVTIEVTSIFASYATISNLKNNVTILCKAKNSNGEDLKSLDLFVKRTFSFEVKQAPQNETIKYGTEGRLNCEVEAYPEATTRWFHNDTVLTNSDHQTVLIKSMTIEDTGEYKCEVSNEYATRYYTAWIDISGLEAPQVDLDSEILLKPGDWKEVDCVVKGIPTPNITWKYKSDDESYFDAIPGGVNVEDGKMQIPSANKEHSGLYRCEAFNVVGQDYRDMTVKIQWCNNPKPSDNTHETEPLSLDAPIVTNIPDTLTVNEGDVVELKCEVDAFPSARVWWEMYQDDISIVFDNRHIIDESDDHYTHRFDALWKDSGNYHCIAENSVGRTEKTVTVNVLVAPYIQPAQHKHVITTVGSSLSLTCEVLYGNPVPSTKWEFISLSATRTLLLRGNSTNTLHLLNVTKDNEGSYICIADNDVASDSIKIDLKIQ